MNFSNIHHSDKIALQNFLLDSDCLNELAPWTDHFNLFDVLKISRTEIRHSNMLGWLLNPHENHGMGDTFLKSIIQELVRNDSNGRYDIFQTLLLNFYSFMVYREWKNIDLLLISDQEQCIIAIENKIGTHEHSDQLNRYRKILESEYPSYTKMLIFLTPGGESPSDTKNWDSLNYTSIADILWNLKNELELRTDIKLLIENYIDIIRRDIVEDQALIEICNRIYAKHKKALDLIFEYKTDSYSQFINGTRSALSKIAANGTIRLLNTNPSGRYFIFHTPSMDHLLPPIAEPNSSWATNFVYQYWIRLYDNRLYGAFELGGWNVPDVTLKTMQKIINCLKPNDKRKEQFRYKQVFRTKWYTVEESDHVQEDVETYVYHIVDELLKQEKELLDQLNVSNPSSIY